MLRARWPPELITGISSASAPPVRPVAAAGSLARSLQACCEDGARARSGRLCAAPPLGGMVPEATSGRREGVHEIRPTVGGRGVSTAAPSSS